MAWISGNRYLTMSEMQNNADLIHYYFSAKGWTDNAIAAMLGNMQSESSINPGIWEGLTPPSAGQTNVGYGLVQWTPYTKYSEWAGTGWEDNGNKEMERIIWELDNHIQWGQTTTYPMTFKAFTQSNETPAYLAQVWMYNYEKPADLNQPQRSTQATAWYEYITGHPPVPSSIPVWLLFKLARRGK